MVQKALVAIAALAVMVAFSVSTADAGRGKKKQRLPRRHGYFDFTRWPQHGSHSDLLERNPCI